MLSSIILNTRFGDSKEKPTEEELLNAINEIYDENRHDLTEADYKEHPNAWLNYGYEDKDMWTVFTLDVYRNGTILFTKYKDQDDDEPEFEYTITNTNKDKAIELWKLLCNGNIDNVLNHFTHRS
ncbi:MAG TPA: hypothetical protein DHV55_01820 [Clostridiaceae bacterium]|nr:hypothetical protein [Clostridiaceae bacterium]